MTAVDLDELEPLAKAATPGPWRVFGCNDEHTASRNHACYRVQAAKSYNVEPDNRDYIAAFSPDVTLALISELRTLRASAAEAEWRPLINPDGMVAVDEGESYWFAVQVSTSGAPPCWEYWQDSVVWDAETEPDFAGDPGWSISDEIYFRTLPSPPEKGSTLPSAQEPPARAVVEKSVWVHDFHGMRATVEQVNGESIHLRWEDGERRAWPLWQFVRHFTWISDPQEGERES